MTAEGASGPGGAHEPEDGRAAGRRPHGFGDEPALVDAVRRGDEAAFGRLVGRYTEPAYAVAVSILRGGADAEDAVQEAFIRALERIDQLEPGSPFGPWFYRVLRSTALNLARRERLRSHVVLDETLTGAGGPGPERDLERSVARERVLEALERLPEMQRSAVLLYDLEGYDHREIGGILGIAEGTSRAHVHHGRRALRRILGKGRGEEAD